MFSAFCRDDFIHTVWIKYVPKALQITLLLFFIGPQFPSLPMEQFTTKGCTIFIILSKGLLSNEDK